MRHVRLTWKGAYHHIMNRGIREEKIFHNKELKEFYIDLLKEHSKSMRIRIFAYCIMDNHFHLVLENSSGRLSDFMKKVNSEYGIMYQKKISGKGYVFHDRFKSTLIQDDSYLVTAILYVLQNPVRAGIVSDAFKYQWSSIQIYFSEIPQQWIDREYVLNLFGSEKQIITELNRYDKTNLKERFSKYGRIMGSEEFVKEAEVKYDRRNKENDFTLGSRLDDKNFEPIEKVISEFEKKIKKKIYEIDTTTISGKRERADLLVYLKDLCGLKYSEIYKNPEILIFCNLKYNSLSKIYSDAKNRQKKIKKLI